MLSYSQKEKPILWVELWDGKRKDNILFLVLFMEGAFEL